MGKYLLDRETILDVSVNIIPLVIILVFFVLFVLVDPYAWEPLTVVVSLGLLVVPFGFLALVTYLTGWTIQREKEEQNT